MTAFGACRREGDLVDWREKDRTAVVKTNIHKRKTFMKKIIVAALLALGAGMAGAVDETIYGTNVWCGASSGGDWSDPANWTAVNSTHNAEELLALNCVYDIRTLADGAQLTNKIPYGIYALRPLVHHLYGKVLLCHRILAVDELVRYVRSADSRVENLEHFVYALVEQTYAGSRGESTAVPVKVVLVNRHKRQAAIIVIHKLRIHKLVVLHHSISLWCQRQESVKFLFVLEKRHIVFQ